MNNFYFYLDGVSFYHKYNPLDHARGPKGKSGEKGRRDCLWLQRERTQARAEGLLKWLKPFPMEKALYSVNNMKN